MGSTVGLNSDEVEKRIREGKVNVQPRGSERGVRDIVLSNTITFFNLINVILLILVLLVGSYKNTIFFLVAVVNTAIGIYQELRARETLSKLNIMNAVHCSVLRDGEKKVIPIDEIVLGDLIYLKTGDQIPTDSTVLRGHLEADESLLTGESTSVVKDPDDTVLSGSFVVSGTAIVRAFRVGADNYSYKITNEAKIYRKSKSLLSHSINKILRFSSALVVPVGSLLFIKEYFFSHATITESVVHTVAGMLGMIPEGLVLLTTLSLTMGVMKLAKEGTLVQQLNCIETLARVDVLCLDKTGTITQARMRVEKAVSWNNEKITRYVRMLTGAITDRNATMKAIAEEFPPEEVYAKRVISFSSSRKYSGAVFSDCALFLGAPEFLFPSADEKDPFLTECGSYAEKGYRVVALARSANLPAGEELPPGLEPIGMLLLTDVLRRNVYNTLSYFRKQDVTIKVISGDDPRTVRAIASRAGLAKDSLEAVDATTLKTPEQIEDACEKYHIFGRVTPEQKKALVIALRKHGHVVAMTGDGVNDIPALKQADCSIAIGTGSDAAKNCANLVLLGSDFSSLPHIVDEGRRVINNIRMAASMFLIKTIFSSILSFLSIFIGSGYPFEPIQMSLISGCCDGLPVFLLQLEPNHDPVGENILFRSFKGAFPSGLTIALCVILAVIADGIFHFEESGLGTVCTIVTGFIYTCSLYRVYSPLTAMRVSVILLCQALLFAAMFFGPGLLDLVTPHTASLITIIVLCAGSFWLTDLFAKIDLRPLKKTFSD